MFWSVRNRVPSTEFIHCAKLWVFEVSYRLFWAYMQTLNGSNSGLRMNCIKGTRFLTPIEEANNLVYATCDITFRWVCPDHINKINHSFSVKNRELAFVF